MPAGVLLADRWRTARRRSACGLCGGLVNVGVRIARIVEDGRPRWCHLACVLAEQRVGRSVEDIWLPGDRPAR